jgi:hypothetical protein
MMRPRIEPNLVILAAIQRMASVKLLELSSIQLSGSVDIRLVGQLFKVTRVLLVADIISQTQLVQHLDFVVRFF